MAAVVSGFPEYFASTSDLRCHSNEPVSVETPVLNYWAFCAPKNLAGPFVSTFTNRDSYCDLFVDGALAPETASLESLPSYPGYVPSAGDAVPYSAPNRSSTLSSSECSCASASRFFSNREVEYANSSTVDQVGTNVADVQNCAPAPSNSHSSNLSSCALLFGCHDDDVFADVPHREIQDHLLTHDPSQRLIDDAWFVSAIDSLVNSGDSTELVESLVAASSSIIDPAGSSVPSFVAKRTSPDVHRSFETALVHTRTEETPAEQPS